jgi:hypothetical protein
VPPASGGPSDTHRPGFAITLQPGLHASVSGGAKIPHL